jgi:hypothetical protein
MTMGVNDQQSQDEYLKMSELALIRIERTKDRV